MPSPEVPAVVRFRQETYVDSEGRVLLALYPLIEGAPIYRGRGVAHVTAGPLAVNVPYDFQIEASTPDEAFDNYDTVATAAQNQPEVIARAKEMMFQQQQRSAPQGLVDASGQPVTRQPIRMHRG